MLSLRQTCQVGVHGKNPQGDFDGHVECTDNADLEGDEAVDPFRRLDFGVVGGAGIRGGWFGLPLSAQLRYSSSIGRITKRAYAGENGRNSTISILIGFGF